MEDLYPGCVLWFDSRKKSGVVVAVDGSTYLFDLKPHFNSASSTEPDSPINQVEDWIPYPGDLVLFSVKFWTGNRRENKHRVTSIRPSEIAPEDACELIELYDEHQRNWRARRTFRTAPLR